MIYLMYTVPFQPSYGWYIQYILYNLPSRFKSVWYIKWTGVTVRQRTTLQNVFRHFTFLYFAIFFIPYYLLKISIPEISRISDHEDDILIFSKKCSKIQLLSWIFSTKSELKKDEKYYKISTLNIMHRIKFNIYKL